VVAAIEPLTMDPVVLAHNSRPNLTRDGAHPSALEGWAQRGPLLSELEFDFLGHPHDRVHLSVAQARLQIFAAGGLLVWRDLKCVAWDFCAGW
jgi:hypothetical protein